MAAIDYCSSTSSLNYPPSVIAAPTSTIVADVQWLFGQRRLKLADDEGRALCSYVIPVLRNTTTVAFADGTPRATIARTALRPHSWTLTSSDGTTLKASVTALGQVHIDTHGLDVALNATGGVDLLFGGMALGELRSNKAAYTLSYNDDVLSSLKGATRSYLIAFCFFLFAHFPDNVTRPNAAPLVQQQALLSGTAPLAAVM